MKLFGSALVLLSLPLPVFASIVISEVMYDLPGTDTKREWIEVTNVGSVPLDIASFIFYEGNTSHKIKAFEGGSELLPGAAAVIALDATQFKGDNPSYQGVLVDSSWSSLSNDGEVLEVRDSEGIVYDRGTYTKSQGASGNDMSLERSGQIFVENSPSPGVAPSSLPQALATYKSPSPPPPSPEIMPEPVVPAPVETASQTASTDKEQEESEAQVIADQPVIKETTVNEQPGAQDLNGAKKNTAPKTIQAPVVQERSEEGIPSVDEAFLSSDNLVAEALEAETSQSSLWLYILALAALLGVASVGVMLTVGGTGGKTGPGKTNEADSYTIVE